MGNDLSCVMKLLFTPHEITAQFRRLTGQYSFFDWPVAWASTEFTGFDLLTKHRNKIRRLVVGTEFHQTHPNFIAEFQHEPSVRFRLDQDSLAQRCAFPPRDVKEAILTLMTSCVNGSDYLFRSPGLIENGTVAPPGLALASLRPAFQLRPSAPPSLH